MLTEVPHRRWNPLKEEWILVSPHRAKRPWNGKIDALPVEKLPQYDPHCNLCPGNLRKNGTHNPIYSSIFVFDNDFPAVYNENSNAFNEPTMASDGIKSIIRSYPEVGICRVICFSPQHDLTFAEMEVKDILKVINCWSEQFKDLISKQNINHVMIFENKGEIMGCSNPHPHGQIWATESIPTIPQKEIEAQEKYFNSYKTHLLADYLKWEIKEDTRIVTKNDEWICLVPYWATWPFEVMIIPLRYQVADINQLTESEKESWASIIKDITCRYDKLFMCSFPYSMGIFQRPCGTTTSGFTFNQKFFPPLLRSATVKKFMVGYELCAEAQRDFTPESAAQRLRLLS